MEPPRGPLLTIPVLAVTLAGKATQIVPELIETQGGPQMTLRVGEHGERAVIPGQQSLQELIQALVAVGQKHLELNEGES